MLKPIAVFISLIMAGLTFAGSGRFFAIEGLGRSASLSVTLCLNGHSPRSCQNYMTNNLTLTIRTMIPNRTYGTAGIKINTPGYTVANTDSGCFPTSNGYCLFTVSDLRSKIIRVRPTTAATILGSSVAGLALMINGRERVITITNTGQEPALNVTYTPSPALPAGTMITPASCGTMAPGSSCLLTIKPGSTPSVLPGDTKPMPITLGIAGDNTNSLTPVINVLTYGSMYQAGYIFAIDDTTPINGSIGGKVAALNDQTPPDMRGVFWSAAANVCKEYNISSTGDSPCKPCATGTCYNDWYLPAICEMGYSDVRSGFLCGSILSPQFPNMATNLYDKGIAALSGYYWSATEHSDSPQNTAWLQAYVSSAQQAFQDKTAFEFKIRCVRALTN